MDVSGLDQNVTVKSKRPSGKCCDFGSRTCWSLMRTFKHFQTQTLNNKGEVHEIFTYLPLLLISLVSNYRLPSWQPVLTAGTVLPTFFIIGIAFIPVGIALLFFSNNVSHRLIFRRTAKCYQYLDLVDFGAYRGLHKMSQSCWRSSISELDLCWRHPCQPSAFVWWFLRMSDRIHSEGRLRWRRLHVLRVDKLLSEPSAIREVSWWQSVARRVRSRGINRLHSFPRKRPTENDRSLRSYCQLPLQRHVEPTFNVVWGHFNV